MEKSCRREKDAPRDAEQDDILIDNVWCPGAPMRASQRSAAARPSKREKASGEVVLLPCHFSRSIEREIDVICSFAF